MLRIFRRSVLNDSFFASGREPWIPLPDFNPAVLPESREKASSVKWDRTRFFEGAESLISPDDQEFFCDHEVEKITREEVEKYGARFQELFSALPWLKKELSPKGSREGDRTEMYFITTEDEKSRVEYWIVSEGYFVAAELEGGLCWALGCMEGHPFVETNPWSFVNSDGSTDETEDRLVSWDLLPSFLIQTTLKYLFSQRH